MLSKKVLLVVTFIIVAVALSAVLVKLFVLDKNTPAETDTSTSTFSEGAQNRIKEVVNNTQSDDFEYKRSELADILEAAQQMAFGGFLTESLTTLSKIPDSEPTSIIIQKYEMCLFATETNKNQHEYSKCRDEFRSQLKDKGDDEKAKNLLSKFDKEYPAQYKAPQYGGEER